MTTLKVLRTILLGCLAIGLGTVGGCKKPPRSSIVTGRLDVESFPAKDARLVAANDRGGAIDIPVAADGSFLARLQRGGSWGLFIRSQQQVVPVVLRRRNAELGATVRVETGGAVVDLGTLRYWPGAAPAPKAVFEATGVLPMDSKVTLQSPAQALPASGGAAPTACVNLDDSDSDSDSDDDDEHEDDGVHYTGGPALQGQVDASQAIALGTFDLPDTLYCAEFVDHDCEGHGDGDRDDHH